MAESMTHGAYDDLMSVIESSEYKGMIWAFPSIQDNAGPYIVVPVIFRLPL